MIFTKIRRHPTYLVVKDMFSKDSILNKKIRRHPIYGS